MDRDLKVTKVPVGQLVSDPANARKHSKRNLDAIAASLEKFGQVRPILVRRGKVIAGNGTLQSAKSIGWSDIAVIEVPDSWDEDQAKAYALVDNRTAELAEWDEPVLAGQLLDLDASGWDLSALGFDAPNAEDEPDLTDDEIPEPPKEPVTKLGDVWQVGPHRVMCADSTDSKAYDQLLNNKKISCVWTDPPYGVAHVGGDTNLSPEARKAAGGLTIENDTLSVPALTELLRASLSATLARCELGGGWYVAAPHGPVGIAFSTVLTELEVWKHSLVWVKDKLVMGRADYHYKHEPLYYGWTPGAAHIWLGDRKQTTVLEFPRPKRSTEHPTMKPIELIAYCLNNSAPKGSVVFDPFAGSGSTLVAAARVGRIGYWIELDPTYVDVIVKRLENETGLTAELLSENP